MTPAVSNYIVIAGNCAEGVFVMYSTVGASTDTGDWDGAVMSGGGAGSWLRPYPQEPISVDGTWYATRGYWYNNGYYADAVSSSGTPYAPAGVWTSVVCDDIEKTCLMPSASAYRLFGYGDSFGADDTIQEYVDLPLGSGSWSVLYDSDDIADLFGHLGDYTDMYLFRMQFSNAASQEGWGWVGGRLEYDDGTEHVFYFCLATQDAWSTIKYSTQVGPDYEAGVDYVAAVPPAWPCALAYDNHAEDLFVLVCQQPQSDDNITPGVDGWYKLYKSQDYGFSFLLVNSKTFEWGTDGYFDFSSELAHCDIWIPWVSASHTGGTMFWSVAMMTVALNDDDPYVTQVYRSTDSGTNETNIGDDGGLTGAITFLGGPYNSSSKLYAGCSTSDQGVVAPKAAIYTWELGGSWTRFENDIGAVWNARSQQNWRVLAQSDSDLTRGMGFREPLVVDETHPNGVMPGNGAHEYVKWLTYIPDAIPEGTSIAGPGSISISRHVFGGVPRCIVIGTSDGFSYITDTLDVTGAWSSLADSGEYPHPVCVFVNGFFSDDQGVLAFRHDTSGADAVASITGILSGSAVATSIGNTGMGTAGVSAAYVGRLLRVSADGNTMVYADDDYVWASVDAGSSWSVYATSTFLPTVLAGTAGYGFIVTNLGGGGGVSNRVDHITILGGVEDKTGNLADVSGGITNCCEVVWFGNIL